MVWVFHTPPISQVLNCRTLFLFYGKFFHRFPSFPNPSSPSSLRVFAWQRRYKAKKSYGLQRNARKPLPHQQTLWESGIVPRVMRIYWLSSLGKKKNIWLCRIFTIEFFSFFWAAAKETCNEKEKPEFLPVYGRLKEKKKQLQLDNPWVNKFASGFLPYHPIPYYPKRMSNGCIFIASACIGG